VVQAPRAARDDVHSRRPRVRVRIGLEALLQAGEDYHDELTRARTIRSDGRVARVQADDGRRTLVAFCDAAGLDAVYRRLSEAVGMPLPLPPTHVTLYTAEPATKGIGLSTQAHVQQRAIPLSDADAAAVLRHLPATA
jgi:hypothetical protein